MSTPIIVGLALFLAGTSIASAAGRPLGKVPGHFAGLELVEVNLDIEQHRHRLAVLHRRLEAVLLDRLHCRLVHSRAHTPEDAHILGYTFWIHNHIDEDYFVHAFGPPRKYGVDAIGKRRRAHTVPDWLHANSRLLKVLLGARSRLNL